MASLRVARASLVNLSFRDSKKCEDIAFNQSAAT
jgi:hypothetical protein